jgi:translation initiation factor RLI1
VVTVFVCSTVFGRYKPQTIAPSFEGSVRDLLQKKIRDAFLHSQFQTDVFKPLGIEELLDQVSVVVACLCMC